MVVYRKPPLGPLRIAIEKEYEFTEEALVQALARHPDVDIVYNANPNGTPTEAANRHAAQVGFEILLFGEL